jgi:hypothetical protein
MPPLPSEQDGGPVDPIDRVIASLNEAFAADPMACHLLMCNRVECNLAFADHPHIVCDESAAIGLPGRFTVGPLGFCNGILGALGLPVIWSRWSDPHEGGQRRLLGFCRTEPQAIPGE